MKFYRELLSRLRGKEFRAKQLDEYFYKKWVFDFSSMTVLPEDLRKNLSKLDLPLKKIDLKVSKKDWTVKVLFETYDKHKIESVLMRHKWNRNTVCVSCQVWCGQWCTFCATWKLWLKRNLDSDEITFQVLYLNKYLMETEENQKVTNVVYMWMWEPFLNYEQVSKSIDNLHNQKKLWLSARSITISTSWVIPYFDKFASEDRQLNLAISIHAWTNKTRSNLMPINNAYPIEDLIKAASEYQKRSNRKIFYEYIMIKDKNDDISEAKALAELIKNQVAHVNIIPFNPWANDEFNVSEKKVMHDFQKIFSEYWIPSTIRVSLGQDIDWACGQLAGK